MTAAEGRDRRRPKAVADAAEGCYPRRPKAAMAAGGRDKCRLPPRAEVAAVVRDRRRPKVTMAAVGRDQRRRLQRAAVEVVGRDRRWPKAATDRAAGGRGSVVTAAEDRDRRRSKILSGREAAAKRPWRRTTRSGQFGAFQHCAFLGSSRSSTRPDAAISGGGGRRPKAAVDGGRRPERPRSSRHEGE